MLEIFHIAAGKEPQEWSWSFDCVMKLSKAGARQEKNKIISGNYLRGIPPSK